MHRAVVTYSFSVMTIVFRWQVKTPLLLSALDSSWLRSHTLFPRSSERNDQVPQINNRRRNFGD